MSVSSAANYLIGRYNYQSYLEIGIHRGRTFKGVECNLKVGVEPAGRKKGGMHPTYAMTSDEFFSQNEDYFDIVFIDGLHHADQFTRDVINSLEYLNEGGIVLCHDVNPTSKLFQIVPRAADTKEKRLRCWRGDVWKGWVKFRATREDLWMYTIQSPTDKGGHALGAIRKGKQDLLPLSRKLIDPSYEDFNENRKEWLNLVDWEEFKGKLNEQ